MAKAQILVVEDEVFVAATIQNMLDNLGYSVVSISSSGEEAIKRVGETHPDLVLMDIMLKGESVEQLTAMITMHLLTLMQLRYAAIVLMKIVME